MTPPPLEDFQKNHPIWGREASLNLFCMQRVIKLFLFYFKDDFTGLCPFCPGQVPQLHHHQAFTGKETKLTTLKNPPSRADDNVSVSLFHKTFG